MRASRTLLAASLSLAVIVTIAGSTAPAQGAPAAPGSSRSPLDAFHAQSTSWISPAQGWMLGLAPCDSGYCTTVMGTTNGGARWNELGTLPAPLTNLKADGVTEIVFADALHGYAYHPALWVTDDGGVTWTDETARAVRPVIALDSDPGITYFVVSACKLEQFPDCGTRATLWHTVPGSDVWNHVSITLPVVNQAVVRVHGLTDYLMIPSFSRNPDVLAATTDGRTWHHRLDPCHHSDDEMLVDAAPIDAHRVAFLCVGDPGFSKAVKRIAASSDAGIHTHSDGITGIWGIISEIAGTPDGTLEVSSWSDGSWIYRYQGARAWETVIDDADLGQGWNDIQFVNDTTGFIVHGPAAGCCRGRSGQLWRTDDGGLTWRPA